LELAGNLHLARNFDQAFIAEEHKPLLVQWKEAAEVRRRMGIEVSDAFAIDAEMIENEE